MKPGFRFIDLDSLRSSKTTNFHTLILPGKSSRYAGFWAFIPEHSLIHERVRMPGQQSWIFHQNDGFVLCWAFIVLSSYHRNLYLITITNQCRVSSKMETDRKDKTSPVKPSMLSCCPIMLGKKCAYW